MTSAPRARVLSADCPWPFDQADDIDGSRWGTIEQHYKPLSMIELKLFPIPPMEYDAVLALWRVASMPQEALDVVKAWGFTAKAEIVWLKRTKTGKRHFGMGRQVRMEHEVAIIATRGKAEPKVKNIRSTFEAPCPVYPVGHPKAGRTIHSAKPEKFYDILEELYRGPYAELFARRRRPGWDCHGNQLPPAEAPCSS